MHIIFKQAEVGIYENMDIGYSVSSKADYVSIPLRSLRGDAERFKHVHNCSLDLKSPLTCVMWSAVDEFQLLFLKSEFSL